MNPNVPLELRVAFNGHGFRWPFRDSDTMEVWQGADYLGELPGSLVLMVLSHHIATAKLLADLVIALDAPSERRSYYEGKPPARAPSRRAKSRPDATAAS